MESLQYNAKRTATGAIRRSSTEKMFEELGLESLKLRCWYKKMTFCIKFSKVNHHHHFNTIPNSQMKNSGNTSSFFLNMIILTILYLLLQWLSGINEVFKKHILSFIKPMPNSIYNISNLLGVIYVRRLRFWFSHPK